MTAALSWAYRSPYTLGFLYFDDWCIHARTHAHTQSHACRLPLIFRSIKMPDFHTHPHTLLPHPPHGLIHLLHLRMQPPWCHLQSQDFKGIDVPQCHQLKEQTDPIASSFVLLSPNGNSPAEGPYMVKGELHSVLYYQVFLSSCPLALTVCTTVTMTSFLFVISPSLTWKKLPWCEDLCVLASVLLCVCAWVGSCAIVYLHLNERWLCVLRIPWLQCCWYVCPPKAPIGNAHKQGMMWWDKAIIQPPH